jgi:opacity protein-like surface antigen
MRNWVDNNNLPIEQTSTLLRVPIMAGLRFDLASPGRTLGKLAWVPNRILPYVAAGGGTVFYKFLQKGDFVDSKSLDVFNDELISSAWTPGAYGAVGVEFAVGPSISLTTEARYDKASAKTSTDFSGFDRIDLSGVGVSLGFSIRY